MRVRVAKAGSPRAAEEKDRVFDGYLGDLHADEAPDAEPRDRHRYAKQAAGQSTDHGAQGEKAKVKLTLEDGGGHRSDGLNGYRNAGPTHEICERRLTKRSRYCACQEPNQCRKQ